MTEAFESKVEKEARELMERLVDAWEAEREQVRALNDVLAGRRTNLRVIAGGRDA